MPTTVTVNTSGVNGLKVEIPVVNKGPGIVAVLVRANGTMTRGMLVTVLVRYENVDTEGRSARYVKGTAWAMDKGLSDGSRLDDSITREQRGLTLGAALPAGRWLQSLCVTQKCSDYNLCRSGWEHRIGGRSGMNFRNAMMN